MGEGGGICTAEVEDKEPEGEKEETEVGGKHIRKLTEGRDGVWGACSGC